MRTVCFVLGTYNRRAMLENALRSIHHAAHGVKYDIAVVDGGSTDGSREWLARQKDVVLICQTGPLTGAVPAFNLGFGHAVDAGYDYVFHFNDDAEIVTENSIMRAITMMDDDQSIGEVAFELDLRGSYNFEFINGYIYANFGLVRTKAGIQAAQAQGDPHGRLWWNPIYKTYGGDSEFGIWLWKTGWKVHGGHGLRVHDLNAQDELRKGNDCSNPNRKDSEIFWDRWRGWTGP